MRLKCPLCGPRDRREFTFRGPDLLAARPGDGATDLDWHRYLHLRDNPAGEAQELWSHEMGCRAWLRVRRNTVTHAVLEVTLMKDPWA